MVKTRYQVNVRKGLLDIFLDLAASGKNKEYCAVFTSSKYGFNVNKNNIIDINLENLHIIENISTAPELEFIMHPLQIFNITKFVNNSYIVGIIHNHTDSNLEPSKKDLENLKKIKFHGAYIITNTNYKFNPLVFNHLDIDENVQPASINLKA